MEEEKKTFNWAFMSSFILKIIALLTMTVDHVGALLQMNVGMNYLPAIIMRYIGRIALPLFCFMIAEGVIHSKKPSKYLLRLGIMATIIATAMIVIEYAPIFDGFSMRSEGNIYIDLLLGALAVYLLRNKRPVIKLLAILPIGISILSFFVKCLESTGTVVIHWFPFFLNTQYFFYGVGMIVLFYVVHYFKNMFLQYYSEKSGIDVPSLEGTNVERYSLNIFSFGVVTILTVLLFVITLVIPPDWVFWDRGIQNAAIIGGAFLLLYSGKRGYNAKWFQYGSYLYYPIHLLVIYGIGMLL